MADVIRFPRRSDANSPELRAAVLAHVLHHVGMVPGPVTYGAVFHATLKAVGRSEEDCSLEIAEAAYLFVRSGLLVSNTCMENGLSITADTMLTVSPGITGWIWRDDAPSGDAG